MSGLGERWDALFQRIVRPSPIRKGEEENDAILDAQTRQRDHLRYAWASDDVASLDFLPHLDSEIERLELEMDEATSDHAKMILLQGRITALKSVRRTFHQWRRPMASPEE